ncbi:MAG: hypothetical protein AAFY56_17195 [Pseudomonadota bacterium]
MLGLLVLAAIGAYEVGASQMRAEVERLRDRSEQLQQVGGALNERLAAARQQKLDVEAKLTALEQRYQTEVPQGMRKRFLEQIDRKIAQGVSQERLWFVIRSLSQESRCYPDIETNRILLQTPRATVPINAISFAGNRVTVTGSGSSARNEDGQPETWYDPMKAVELRFLTIAGEVSTTRGVMPLASAIVLGDQELKFMARASEVPGLAEITMQICDFP